MLRFRAVPKLLSQRGEIPVQNSSWHWKQGRKKPLRDTANIKKTVHSERWWTGDLGDWVSFCHGTRGGLMSCTLAHPDRISQGRTGQEARQPPSGSTVFVNLSAQAPPALFEHCAQERAQELPQACRFTAVSYLREQVTGTRCKWSKRNLKTSSPSWFLERLKGKRTKLWTQTRVVTLLWEASKERGVLSGFRSPLSLWRFLLCELLFYKTSNAWTPGQAHIKSSECCLKEELKESNKYFTMATDWKPQGCCPTQAQALLEHTYRSHVITNRFLNQFLKSEGRHTHTGKPGWCWAMLTRLFWVTPAQGDGDNLHATYSSSARHPCCSRTLQSFSICLWPMAQSVSLNKAEQELKPIQPLRLLNWDPKHCWQDKAPWLPAPQPSYSRIFEYLHKPHQNKRLSCYMSVPAGCLLALRACS